MKKTISLFLMLLLLVGTMIPLSVSATGNLSNYFFADFEDGLEGFTATSGHGSVAVADGGYNGSVKALCYTDSETSCRSSQTDLLLDLDNGTLPSGYTLKISFKLKLLQEVAYGNLQPLLRATPEGGSSAWINRQNMYTPIDTDDTENWQSINIEFDADANYTIEYLRLRFGGYDVTTNDAHTNYCVGTDANGDAYTADNPGVRSYLIDDFEYKIEYIPRSYTLYDDFNDKTIKVSKVDLDNYFAYVGAEYSRNNTRVLKVGTTKQNPALRTPAGLAEIKTGDTISYSFWLKVNEAQVGGYILPLIQGTKIDSTKEYIGRDDLVARFNPEDTTNWQFVQGKHIAQKDYTIEKGYADIRLGGYSSSEVNYLKGDGYSATNPGTRTYYIDDIKFDIISADDESVVKPTVSNVKFFGKIGGNEKINFEYNFTTANSANDLSILRLVKKDTDGNNVYLGTSYLKDGIILPALDANTNYYFEIIPKDSNSLTGAVTELAIPAIGSIYNKTGVDIAFNHMDGTAKAIINTTANFTELYPSMSSAQIIIAAYDQNNKMINSAITPFDAANNAEIPATLAFDEGLAEIIKCFVWSNDGKCVPITSSTVRIVNQSITCWGDSLTQQDKDTYIDVVKEITGGEESIFATDENLSYSEVLARLSGKTVNNHGCGGDTVTMIATRQGAMTLTADAFTIPADTTPVEVTLHTENDTTVMLGFQGGEAKSNFNPCTINGVEGKIAPVWYDESDAENDQRDPSKYYYTFTRLSEGTETSVSDGTAVIPNSTVEGNPNNRNKDIVVIFMGANGGYGDTMEDYFAIVDRMIENLNYENKEYVIVAWPHENGSSVAPAEREEMFIERYGERVLPLYSILCANKEATFEKYGITAAHLADRDDYDRTINLEIENLLLSDRVHFSAVGYYILGAELYEKMLDLGILVK